MWVTRVWMWITILLMLYFTEFYKKLLLQIKCPSIFKEQACVPKIETQLAPKVWITHCEPVFKILMVTIKTKKIINGLVKLLYKRYGGQGVVILGVPFLHFGDPGDNLRIFGSHLQCSIYKCLEVTCSIP